MKAKSKVLLGLIVALAMMVMAVPAFAVGLIESVTPATQEVYAGGNVVLTLKVNADTSATAPAVTVTAADVVTPQDGTTGPATISIPAGAFVKDKNDPTVYKAEIATTPANCLKKNEDGASVDTTHNITVTVTQGNNESKETVTVTLHPEVTATLQSVKNQAGNAFEETVVKGKEAVANVTCGDANVAFQWQSSSAAAEADDVDSDKWTDIEGKTAAAVGTVDDLSGKYIRCLVIKNKGEANEAKFVAKATLKEAIAADPSNNIEGSDAVIAYCVKINVTDDSGIVITTQPEAPKAPYFKNDDETNATIVKPLTAAATVKKANGTAGTPEYEWYKDGKVKVERGSTTECVPDTEEAGEFEYFCRVYASDAADAQYVDTNKVKVTVKDVPTITVENAKAETPLTWPKGKASLTTEALGSGTVVVTDLTQPLTLTAVIENNAGLTETQTQWLTEGDVPLVSSKTYTIQPDATTKKIATGKYKFKAAFGDLTNAGTYTVNVVEGKGTLKGANGGIYTSTDGTDDNPAFSPEYTIQLPTGYKFATTYTKNGEIEGNASTGDVITGPEGVVFTIKDITTAPTTETADGQKMTFVVKQFKPGEALTKPYIKDMEATFSIQLAKAESTPETVALNVTDAGYKITLPGKYSDVKMTAPETETATAGKVEVYYDGTAKTATVEPKDGVEGLGTISNYRYVELLNTTELNHELTAEELKKATKTAPKDVNTAENKAYYVIVDIAKSDKYEKADNVLAGKFEIKAVTPQVVNNDTVKASNYFEMNPKSVVYDGKNKGTKVTFKDGLEKTGKITDTKYYPLKADGTAETNPVIPVKIGKYEVRVTTANDDVDTDNTATNVKASSTGDDGSKYYKVGVFEITKTVPTADLYKIDPAEVNYDGTPREAVVVKDAKAGDVIGKHYFKDGSDKELDGAPTEVGVYTVKIDTAANDNYAATDKDSPLEIGTLTIKEGSISEQPVIYFNAHVQYQGWDKENTKLDPNDPEKSSVLVGTTGLSRRVEAVAVMVPEQYEVVGFAHVQYNGDTKIDEVKETKDYTIPEGYKAYQFGTQGEEKRVEAVCIGIRDKSTHEYVNGFQYATHLAYKGWQGYVRNGSFSGSRGMELRMESLRFTYSKDDVVPMGEPTK